MWTAFFHTFTFALVVAGLASIVISRHRPVVRLLCALLVAFIASTPDLIFGYFPKLSDGWNREIATSLIVLIIVWPFLVLIERLNRK